MRSWSNCKLEIRQAIRSDRLGLVDLHEISDLLLCTGLFSFRVASWSMYPALHKGDQLTVEPASTTSLQVGDVILFHQSGQLICHRVVAIQETEAGPRLITKGDAATGCGETIQPEQVLGKVVAVARRWPWSHRGRWVGTLARWVDRGSEWIAELIALGLQCLHGLRLYRLIMRSILKRSFAFYLGVPERSRWINYQPISHGNNVTLPTDRVDFHLLAKLCGTSVGSLQGKAGPEGYWIESLRVRIRYRGLGVGSQLIALAATAVSRNRPPALLVSVEPTNTAALNLFAKTGFRETGDLRGSEVSLRQDL